MHYMTIEAMKNEASRVVALVKSFAAAGDIAVWQHVDVPAEWQICLNDVAFDHTDWSVCPTSLSGTLAEMIREQLRDLDNLPGLVWHALTEAFTRIEGLMMCVSEGLYRAFETLSGKMRVPTYGGTFEIVAIASFPAELNSHKNPNAVREFVQSVALGNTEIDSLESSARELLAQYPEPAPAPVITADTPVCYSNDTIRQHAPRGLIDTTVR